MATVNNGQGSANVVSILTHGVGEAGCLHEGRHQSSSGILVKDLSSFNIHRPQVGPT